MLVYKDLLNVACLLVGTKFKVKLAQWFWRKCLKTSAIFHRFLLFPHLKRTRTFV